MSDVAATNVEAGGWTLAEGVALCTAIQDLPSEKFHCHPALTGGLLYKQGTRKDCDIVIYQRGDTGGKREPIDWEGGGDYQEKAEEDPDAAMEKAREDKELAKQFEEVEDDIAF